MNTTHEHHIVEKGLMILEAIAHRPSEGEAMPTDKVQASLDFFSFWLDRRNRKVLASESRKALPKIP